MLLAGALREMEFVCVCVCVCVCTYHGQASVLELVELELLEGGLILGETQGVKLEVTGLCVCLCVYVCK